MSAIVVAGGISKRFGQDKGVVTLAGKPFIHHVLDKLNTIVDEIIIIVNSEEQKKTLTQAIHKKTRVMVDKVNVHTSLAGALTGFEAVQNEYTLLLPCDTPFISPEILNFLLEVCANRSAAIPRWPNGNIEPLHAAYHAQTAAEAASAAIKSGKLDMRSMIQGMRNVRYISTIVLQQFNPKLTTFFNINTLNDLRQAEAIVKRHAY